MSSTVEKPYAIQDFFTPELFEKVKAKVDSLELGPQGPLFYHTVAGRWIEAVAFDETVEQEILALARETFNNPNLIRAGIHVARYQRHNGIKPQLWKHYDQSACLYSLDVCLDKTIDWTLVVEDEVFNESPNSAAVFCGNYNMHWRTEYPSDSEEDYVVVLLMQFAEADHWYFTEGKDGFGKHGHEGDFRFRERMGYWSQPDYTDGRPICACCDYRPVLNYEERYAAGERH